MGKVGKRRGYVGEQGYKTSIEGFGRGKRLIVCIEIVVLAKIVIANR